MSAGRVNTLVVTENGTVLDGRLAQAGLPAAVEFHAAAMSEYGVGYALSTEGVAWMWGLDSCGVLGPSRVPWIASEYYVPVAVAQRVVQIGFGRVHVVMLQDDGRVLTSGYNDGRRHFGCTGRPGEAPNVLAPITDAAFVANPAVFVAAGRHTTGAIDSKGAVWMMGTGHDGVLGLGDTADRCTPARLAAFGVSKTVQLAMAGHTVAVGENGEVFAWGANADGQLGLGDFGSRLVPQQLSCPSANTATCSNSHTMILTKRGEVFTCGHNRFGVLGLGEEEPEYTRHSRRSATLTLVAGLPRVACISADAFSVTAVAPDGRLFTWGLSAGSGDTPDVWPGYTYAPTECRQSPVLQQLGARAGLYGHGLAEASAIAFAMLAHPRLGARSPWRGLHKELMPLVNLASVRLPRRETAQSVRARSVV